MPRLKAVMPRRLLDEARPVETAAMAAPQEFGGLDRVPCRGTGLSANRLNGGLDLPEAGDFVLEAPAIDGAVRLDAEPVDRLDVRSRQRVVDRQPEIAVAPCQSQRDGNGGTCNRSFRLCLRLSMFANEAPGKGRPSDPVRPLAGPGPAGDPAPAGRDPSAFPGKSVNRFSVRKMRKKQRAERWGDSGKSRSARAGRPWSGTSNDAGDPPTANGAAENGKTACQLQGNALADECGDYSVFSGLFWLIVIIIQTNCVLNSEHVLFFEI
ncbi:MAG: hypothetical protein R3D02_03240 [Hyphomicrobiales bacterium]